LHRKTITAVIGRIDAFARDRQAAAALTERGALERIIQDHHRDREASEAQAMLAGKASLEASASTTLARNAEPQPRSGRQEMLDNIVAKHI
jgi:xylose isomerase